MTEYILSFVILTAALFIYTRVAERYNIIDKPNERSSHSRPTVRGGGIIFPLAALLWFLLYGFSQPWMITGLLLVAVVSFLDDLFSLPGRLRLLTQLFAVSLIFFQADVLGLPWYVLVPAFIITLGWINAFNFMDGINAITPFYSLTALATFLYINSGQPFISPQLPVMLIIAVLIFSFFNARKHARAFAGDVGSVSMAYLLAFLMLGMVLQTGRYEYILFFAVYALDSAFTIIYRLLRHENIFRAHRAHLYQLLSNEMGWPHVLVAALYALVQLVINILVIVLFSQDIMNLTVFLIIATLLSLAYLLIRILVSKRIKSR